jgi:hypothetical protein
VLGSFANSPSINGVEPVRGRLNTKVAAKPAKKQDLSLNQLLEREWSELPYAMMRISAARRPWDVNRVYWRDNTVQLGDIDLDLVKVPGNNGPTGYVASYTQGGNRRDFVLHSSLENDELRWSAPGISEVQLTTVQLAEKLLSHLVTFYNDGLSKPSPASSASPKRSS